MAKLFLYVLGMAALGSLSCNALAVRLDADATDIRLPHSRPHRVLPDNLQLGPAELLNTLS